MHGTVATSTLKLDPLDPANGRLPAATQEGTRIA
jgi:hypothetical protein